MLVNLGTLSPLELSNNSYSLEFGVHGSAQHVEAL